MTVIPPSEAAPEHVHLDGEPLVQIGWQGQSGRIYRLDERIEPTAGSAEPGGYWPIYRHWGEKCGHQIQSEDMAAAVAEILGR